MIFRKLETEPGPKARISLSAPPQQGFVVIRRGVAIWASVSDEVDARITEQIKAGTFPIRLKPEDWTSGTNHWLLDVIAPDTRATDNVIANFRQVVKDGALKLHPIITRLVDAETLKKMGAVQMGRGDLQSSDLQDSKQ